MSEIVKRVYRSELRSSQARETRRAIVDAAARLFVDEGFGHVTVDAIAERAGVSRRTVFASIGGKVDVLKLALDWAVTGDDEPVALGERPDVARPLVETDPDALLHGWAAVLTRIDARGSGLYAALVVAAGIDAEAAHVWKTAQAQRLSGARAIVQTLAAMNGLRSDLSEGEAVDIAWLYSDPSIYHRLVIDRRWSKKRFERWLSETLRHQLRPSGRGPSFGTVTREVDNDGDAVHPPRAIPHPTEY